MASGRKNTSGRRSYSQKGGSGKKKKTAQEFNWTSELLMFIFIAAAILLFISNLGLGGTVGSACSAFFFGLFGIMSYAFPVLVFVIALFVISNTGAAHKKVSHPVRVAMKTAAIALLFVFLCVFAYLVNSGSANPAPLAVFAESSVSREGGGALGAAIGLPLKRGFGLLGAYIIDIIVLIICVVLITERSFFRGVQKGSGKIYRSAKNSNKKRRENARDKKSASTDTSSLRMNKKVRGVSSDTKITPDKNSSTGDPLSEVNVKATKSEGQKNRSSRAKTDAGAGASAKSKPEIHIAGDEEREDNETVFSVKRKAKSKKEPLDVRAETNETSAAIPDAKPLKADYVFPSPMLLNKSYSKGAGDSRAHLMEMSEKLQNTLNNFGVNARVTNVTCGPAVTQYEIEPEVGVKVSKILGLSDDIKLNLAVPDIRIEAPIPGKSAIGIEVPNKENVTVEFGDLVASKEFSRSESKISFCAGKDIAGNVIMADIAKMPHLLIAGATGSGKSVCINTIIMSILYKASPEDVKLIMIDPKVVELSVYNGIPHLLIPVVTDPKKAAGALGWAVSEMMERYHIFQKYGVRDITGYNKKVESVSASAAGAVDIPQKMPQIVIIVDELADLMMAAASDVEDAICRLAQLARAAGMHLVIATQRPSVNVITGLIKANMPSRIAFAVTSGVDSRTILDMNGAEKLLGKGDMLYYPQNYKKPLRVQGAFVSDKEVADVVDYIIEANGQGSYSPDIEKKVSASELNIGSKSGVSKPSDGRDEYFADAGRFLIEKQKGSIGMIQRMFKVGFNRAARIMDQLQEAGVVSGEDGTKAREVIMTAEQFEQFLAGEQTENEGI